MLRCLPPKKAILIEWFLYTKERGCQSFISQLTNSQCSSGFGMCVWSREGGRKVTSLLWLSLSREMSV